MSQTQKRSIARKEVMRTVNIKGEKVGVLAYADTSEDDLRTLGEIAYA